MKNRRYYSHYTFIYPDILLKNHIVEINENDVIVNVFPFEKELERTEFYSGLLAFIPLEIKINKNELLDEIKEKQLKKAILDFPFQGKYRLSHLESFRI